MILFYVKRAFIIYAVLTTYIVRKYDHNLIIGTVDLT